MFLSQLHNSFLISVHHTFITKHRYPLLLPPVINLYDPKISNVSVNLVILMHIPLLKLPVFHLPLFAIDPLSAPTITRSFHHYSLLWTQHFTGCAVPGMWAGAVSRRAHATCADTPRLWVSRLFRAAIYSRCACADGGWQSKLYAFPISCANPIP